MSEACNHEQEINLLYMELRAVRERMVRALNVIEARLQAMLPDWQDQARYQKLRVICSNRSAMRVFRDSGGKILN
jgi:hypothetical protein